MGVILAIDRGYLVQAFTLGLTEWPIGLHTPSSASACGWRRSCSSTSGSFIWPNQKIALGLVEADADAKAKAARLAMLFSRTNTLLSIPMLVTMTMNQTIFG